MSQAPYGPTPAAWPTPGPPPGRGPSRLPTIIAIVIALIAVAVAVGAWFRPAPKAETAAPKVYSEQETADAKKAVCDAFETVYTALDVNSRKAPNNPGDSFAVIVNTRVAIHLAADYLLSQLEENPAAPQDLSSSVRKLSDTYYQTLLEQIGNGDLAKLDPLYQTAVDIQDGLLKDCK